MDTFCTGMHLSENLTLFVWALRDLDVRTWGKHEFLPTGYLISRNRFCPITGYFLRNFLEISEFSPCPSRHVKYSFRTPSRTLTDTVSANATNKHLSQDAFIVSEHERSLDHVCKARHLLISKHILNHGKDNTKT